MILIGKILVVGALASIALWGSVPVGLALGLSPLCVGITAAAGTSIGVIIAAILSKKLRDWVYRRYWGDQAGANDRTVKYIWTRYGVPGLALIAPLITGAPLGTILGVALGAPINRLIWWMCLGVVIWSTLLTLFFMGSLAALNNLTVGEIINNGLY